VKSLRLLPCHDFLVSCFLVAILAILIPGCSGGGSGGSASQARKSGTVSILVKDGPTVEFDHVFVEVTHVSLLRADDGKAVTVFDGHEKIDLLMFRDQDFLLAQKDVPAGTYEKIRMEISSVEVEPATDCPEVKLPSGKIDLVPQSPFEVTDGGSIQVRLDIDAGKSLFIHQAGKSGKCIFRPVVFVDVTTGASSSCPQEVAGTITKVGDPDDPDAGQSTGDDENDDGDKEDDDQGEDHHGKEHDLASGVTELKEITIDLGGDRGTTIVEILSSTAVFGTDAQKADVSTLAVGDRLQARGTLESGGEIEALWAIEGQPVDLQGTFDSAIADGKFTFKTTEVMDAQTTTATIAFATCGTTPIDLATITAGQSARLLGAQVTEGDTTFLRVAVIELGPKVVRGTIAAVDATAGTAQIKLADDSTVDLTFDSSTEIVLVGGGTLTASDLRVGESVIAHVETDGHASRIEVEPASASGTVKDFDASKRTFTLLVESTDPANPDPTQVKVTVSATATVVLIDAAQKSSQVDLSELKDGDKVDLFGMVPAAGEFDARTVVIRR
jgi:uncharacterized protein DUF4382